MSDVTRKLHVVIVKLAVAANVGGRRFKRGFGSPLYFLPGISA
jgi:hypothetical protein